MDAEEVFHVSQIELLPVTSEVIRRETRRDGNLSKIYEQVVNGWNIACENEQLKPYHNRRNELTVSQGCLLWGIRVIVPVKLRSHILTLLHESHPGIVRMKALARSYVWWPGIDHDIEKLVKQCFGCQKNQNMPAIAPLHPWEWASSPWERIHIDFAGPFMDRMFLVVVDAHSKWPEIVEMKTTTATKTI